MTLVSILFYFFVIVAGGATLALAFTRNVLYGALLLIVCLLALAGIYILAFAEFVAVTQILIYAGGILVIIIFGIMLTSKISEKPLVVEHSYMFSGILVAATCFTMLLYVLSQESFPTQNNQQPTTTISPIETVGVSLFSKYMLPFEIAGVLLLISLIGASVIASTINLKKKDASA
jgi:NADH:ubiquinone oxidoreductase subunit 6 (subunit J)